MGASVTPLLAPWKNRNALAAFVLAAAVLVILAPSGLGLSTGMSKDVSIFPGDFAKNGCTSCHNDKGASGKFAAPSATSNVALAITDAQGQPLAGNAYVKGTVYTITITLTGEQAPDQDNHAGFNLAASAGKLDVPAGSADVQVTKDQSQATHTNAKNTHWSVQWTAPESGAVVFDYFVNDVNGNGGPDGGDHVYRGMGVWLTDGSGAQAGAAAKVEAVEFGISLQQYWIGLIGLAGMIFIMVAGYVFLKFGSEHNSDQKDR